MTTAEAAASDRTPLAITPRRATIADTDRLSAVMARAFDDDPIANWVCMQDKRRARRVYDFMNTAVKKLTLPHDEVFTTDDYAGGALWVPPGKWKLGILQQLMLTPAMARSATWKRIPKIIGGLNAVEKDHPHQPHYYLLALGVEPTLQGKSIGTQLMRPILERCDRERAPAYLESSKEINVPLYERNGFKVTKELVVPNGGPKIWLMWREPQ